MYTFGICTGSGHKQYPVLKTKANRAGHMAPVVEDLPGKCKTLSLSSSSAKWMNKNKSKDQRREMAKVSLEIKRVIKDFYEQFMPINWITYKK